LSCLCFARFLPRLRSFLFPKSSAKMTDIWHTIGLRGTASNEYVIKDLFVPQRFSTSRDNPAVSSSLACLTANTRWKSRNSDLRR